MKNFLLMLFMGIIILAGSSYLAKFITGSSDLMVIAAISAIALVLTVMVLRRNIISDLVFLIIAFIPLFQIINVHQNYFSIVYFLTLLLSMVFGINLIIKKERINFQAHEKILLIFVFYLGLSLIWGYDFRESSKQYVGVLFAAIFSIIVPRSGITSEIYKRIERSIIAWGILLSILGILQITFGALFYPISVFSNLETSYRPTGGDISLLSEGVRSARAVGTFLNPIEMGIYLLLPFFMVLNKLIIKSDIRRFAVLVIISMGIFAVFSKGAYVLVVLGSVMLFMLHHKLNLKRVIVGAAAMLVTISMVYYILSDMSLTVINMFTLNQGDDLLTNIRFDYWKESLKVVQDAFVFGYGYAGVGYIPTLEIGFDPHSTYLSILINQGTVGFALFTAYLCFIMRKYFRPEYLNNASTVVMVVVFVLYLISFMTDGLFLTVPYTYLLPVSLLAAYSKLAAKNK